MPDPKTCIAEGLVVGTKEYEDCIAYKGKYAKKGGGSPVKGSLKNSKPKATGGGY